MFTGTTRTPIFATPDWEAPTIRFLPFWVVRPQTILAAAETMFAGSIAAGVVFGALRSGGDRDAVIGAVAGLVGGQAALHFSGANRAMLESDGQPFLRSVLRSLAAGLALSWVLFLSFPPLSRGLAAGLLAWSVMAGFAAVFRPALRALMRRRLVHALMILGPPRMAESLYEELSRGDDIVHDDANAAMELLMSEECVSRIIIADPRMSAEHDLPALIDSRMRGLKIEQAVESCESMRGKLWLEGLQPEWWIYSHGFIPTRAFRALKYVIDIIGAILLVLMLWPLLLITALAIKLTSRGPVFYRQERVGMAGRTFMAIKFRSMRNDAESKSGPQWAAANDNRITRVGHIIRRFRIDELPQFFNVLKGDMSLIGPRPERRHFVEMLAREIPYYNVRHYVRPGITGWAQVMYPYGASVTDAYEKLQYDLYYAKHMSLPLDLLIIFKTLKVVLSGNGR